MLSQTGRQRVDLKDERDMFSIGFEVNEKQIFDEIDRQLTKLFEIDEKEISRGLHVTTFF